MHGATDAFGDVIERCVGNGEEFTFMDAVEIVVGIACLKGAYNSGKQLASQTASGINSLRRATQEQRARLAEAVKSKSTKIAQGAKQYVSKAGNAVKNELLNNNGGYLDLDGFRIKSGSNTVNPNALKYNGDETWTSNEGLIYGQGSREGNRVRHVLEHTKPNPNKPVHTVFNVDKSNVIGLIPTS